MNWLKFIAIIGLGVGLCVPVVWADAHVTAAQTAEPTSRRSIYWYLGAGIVPQPRHDAEIQNQIIAEKSIGHAGQYAGNLELPGIFFRYSQSSLIGIVPTIYFEQFASDFRDNLSYSLRTYGPQVNWLAFRGEQPGEGYFARLAVGPAQMTELRQTPAAMTKYRYSGWLYQGGVGYAFQFSQSTHFLMEIGAHYAEAGGHFHNGIDFHLGFLL